MSPAKAAFRAALLPLLLLPLTARAEEIPMPVAVLQALDKTTAKTMTLEAAVGDTVRFGTFQIIVRVCTRRPPEEPPESAAFLDVWEAQPGEPAQSVFRGWMFASSPALSAIEHPVYDVWVLECRGATAANRTRP
ncbi:MAG: DUF2155 domain-containing protein [Rhodospirillales bacterium]|nr:DUF2155 domain-containing protein [Rhodospirillales bacterium]